MRSLRGVNVSAVIKRLNPIIRGWTAYYRTQVSSDTFNALDNYLWKLTYKWAKLSHPNKSRRWVISRYFDRFDQSRQDRWVFGNRHRGSYLHKFAWTTIVRHQMVPGGASLDDPSLTEYWTRRRRKATLPINNTTLRLHQAQDGRCPICTGTLNAVEDQPQLPQQWEHWLATTRTAIIRIAPQVGTSDEAELWSSPVRWSTTCLGLVSWPSAEASSLRRCRSEWGRPRACMQDEAGEAMHRTCGPNCGRQDRHQAQ